MRMFSLSTLHLNIAAGLRDVTIRATKSQVTTRLRSLLKSSRGRIPRSTFWYTMLGLWAAFVVLFVVLDVVLGRTSTLLLYVPFYWSLFTVSAKRYHDVGKAALWLLLLLVPVVGVTWVAIELGLRRGTRGENRFGPDSTNLPYSEAAE